MWQPAINTRQRQKSTKDEAAKLKDHTQFLSGSTLQLTVSCTEFYKGRTGHKYTITSNYILCVHWASASLLDTPFYFNVTVLWMDHWRLEQKWSSMQNSFFFKLNSLLIHKTVGSFNLWSQGHIMYV